jgi:aspartate 1-decarboxylase
MRLTVLKSKLHLATVTRSELHYHGSLTVDLNLMNAVGLVPYEAILVSNVATGQRAQTYVLPGKRGSGSIELNGAMARLGTVGDRLIVMAFAELEADEVEGHKPLVVSLDHQNRVTERIEYPPISQVYEPAAFSVAELGWRGGLEEAG